MTDPRHRLLDILIKIFHHSKNISPEEVEKNIGIVRDTFLIGKIGCTEEIADKYISQALERI